MTQRGLIGISVAVVLAMAGFAVFAWLRLPPDAVLPMHWNSAGQVDRTAPAIEALAMPVMVTAVLTIIFSVIPAIEPLQRGMVKSLALYRVAWLGMLAVMVMVEIAIAMPAFGLRDFGIVPVAGVGLFLILLGNVLPKSRPSFFVGIRTPWTLSDPENWIATHRLGGRTMMVGGALMMAVPLLPVDLRVGWTFAAIGIAAIPPVVFSWWYWRKHGRNVER
jgi:uncharacterized membrane protein